MAINKSILEAMEVVATGTKFNVPNADALFRSNLPEGVTPELVEKVEHYVREFDETIYEACLPKMIELMKTDTNIGLAEMEAEAMGRTYGITVARPENENPTLEQLQDGICLFVVEKHSESIGGCVERAAAMWKN